MQFCKYREVGANRKIVCMSAQVGWRFRAESAHMNMKNSQDNLSRKECLAENLVIKSEP